MAYRPPTSVEVNEMIADAYQQGLDDAFTDQDGTTDWDRLVAVYEVGEIDLGNDSDSAVIRKIRAAYRRGRREDR